MAVTLFTVALALTVLVLLTACGNVANLLLGRAAYRRREIAARMALGATRARLVRQLLTESLLLAFLGALGGWLFAAYASSFLGLVRTPLGWPMDLSVAPDARVLVFCLVLSVATGVAFGLLPALRATRPDLVTDLKADAGGLSRRERFVLRNGLAAAQITVCTVLMLCTGLSLRSLQVARTMDVGLNVRNHVLLAFDPSVRERSDVQSRDRFGRFSKSAGGRWCRSSGNIDDRSAFDADHQQLGLRDRRGGGILTCAAYSGRHLCRRAGFFAYGAFRLEGNADFRGGQAGNATGGHRQRGVRACGISGPVMDRTAVLGDGKTLDIVGVVATAKSRSIGEAPRPAIYLPILNELTAGDSLRGVTLVARTRDGGGGTIAGLREAIHAADRLLAVFDVRTMESHVRDALILPRLMWIMSLTAGGITTVACDHRRYGAITFAVAVIDESWAYDWRSAPRPAAFSG